MIPCWFVIDHPYHCKPRASGDDPTAMDVGLLGQGPLGPAHRKPRASGDDPFQDLGTRAHGP